MPAGILDFTQEAGLPLEPGSRFDETITFHDAGGTPLDFTAYDPRVDADHPGGRIMFRKSVDDTDAPILDLEKTTTPGAEGVEIVSPPTAGQIRIVVRGNLLASKSFDTAGDGAPLTDNRTGIAHLEVADKDGRVLRLTEGIYEMIPEAAR